MATYNIGQAAIVPKGEYTATTAYNRLDAVTANGGTWLCKAACKGVHPVTGSNHANYWQLMANGVASMAASSPSDGVERIDYTLSDGTTGGHSFNAYLPADKSLDLGTKMTGVLPIANGGTGGTSASTARNALGAQAKKVMKTISLAPGLTEWTITLAAVTSDAGVICAPAPASWSVWQDCSIRCTEQGTGSLKFAAEAAPEVAVRVNVMVLP